MRQTLRRIRNALPAHLLFVAPGHYYSPVTNAQDRARQVVWDGTAASELPGIDLRAEDQIALATRLLEREGEFQPTRWAADEANSMFGTFDAKVLAGLVGELRPGRVVEVGSGYSTAVLLDMAQSHGTTTDITCIEPYPERLNSLLRDGDSVRLLQQPVQDVPLEEFTRLTSGDLLFIDSTHVVKAGSDVLYLFVEVLPRLAPGVIVHVHDVFWPFSYRAEWVEEGRDWTEAFFLRALLTESPAWQVLLFNDWVWRQIPDLERRTRTAGDRPGSIYLRRTAAGS